MDPHFSKDIILGNVSSEADIKTPDSGLLSIYQRSGTLYSKDSSGTESSLGGGSRPFFFAPNTNIINLNSSWNGGIVNLQIFGSIGSDTFISLDSAGIPVGYEIDIIIYPQDSSLPGTERACFEGITYFQEINRLSYLHESVFRTRNPFSYIKLVMTNNNQWYIGGDLEVVSYVPPA